MAEIEIKFRVDIDDLPSSIEGTTDEEIASEVYDKLDDCTLDIGDFYDPDTTDFLEVTVVDEDDD